MNITSNHPQTSEPIPKITSNFNIFMILGKDDKELIHSAFIQFLLENNYGFCEHFDIDPLSIHKVILEKAYTLEKDINGKKKKIRRRIDIEVLDKHKKPVLVIENKFKSFPYRQQLDDYEEIYKRNYPGENPIKLLFCFDKDLIHFNNSWKVIDYRELNNFVELALKKEDDLEKRIFLRHYIKFLSDFFKKYDGYRQDLGNLLEHPTVAGNKFWLKLMFSAVRIKLEKDFPPPKFRFLVNPGNTSVPLINIIPAHWTFGELEFLLQFQGNELKFYVHILNTKKEKTEAAKIKQKIFLEKVIQLSQEKLIVNGNNSGKAKFKNLGKMKYSSYYLYKEAIITEDSTLKNITLEYLEKRVLDFYKNIDRSILPLISKI